ncbi:DUF6586 family protein [Halomonas binhaiensis]|uniref:Uncharacterized protein n=1 Tax=Halomonas binhaiensis TaxID=2562282 RepID=A0A5C1NID2_9GAMM|nr:DUF6586 family protein [Halomonas binhaiensis]QEM81499.1 hypothetical protein E4T21_08050 [Halomonas binhaiensis]
MTPRARTNQLLYQAELLLTMASGNGGEVGDEHSDARRRAREEGALALMELALNALLRDVTFHAHLTQHHWRELLLGESAPGVAEVVRLRSLVEDPDSWLSWLLARIEALHGDEGASKASAASARLIVGGGGLTESLADCLASMKAEVAALRETSEEW